MKPSLLDAYREVFKDTVRTYYTGVSEHDHNLDIKYEHSFLVLENARAIIEPMELDAHYADLCLLAALFHDLGRFPQYNQYKTFRDALSKNHGVLGALALKRHGIFKDLALADRRLIQATVILHNRRFVPKNIPAPVRRMVRIVRDADKLDIIRIMLLHFSEGNTLNPTVTLHVKDHPTAYSASVYNGVMEEKRGDYRELEWVNDFKLLLCSWGYDLNYPASRWMFRERKYLKELIASLPDTIEIQALAAKVGAALNNETAPTCRD